MEVFEDGKVSVIFLKKIGVMVTVLRDIGTVLGGRNERDQRREGGYVERGYRWRGGTGGGTESLAVVQVDDSRVQAGQKSRTKANLSPSQIEKELLMVVLCTCTKFRDYISGKAIVIKTDHQPLVTIWKQPVHTAPACLQRMCMKIMFL